MELVIIEGAGKIKKITHILKEIGKDAKVFATCGHIEKLKDSEYDQTGISRDIQFDFEWISRKGSTMKQINDAGAYAQNIWIAINPDREVEGIAWHIFNKLNTSNKTKTKRITFNEISKKAIDDAFKKTDQDAIMKNQNLATAGDTTSTVLKVVNILLFVSIGCILNFFLVSIKWYYFKGLKTNDETIDMKQGKSSRKKEIEEVFYSTVLLLVVFLVLALIVTSIKSIYIYVKINRGNE